MKREFIYEEYTSDKLYRFEICRKGNCYELWVQKRHTDPTTDNSCYYDIPDVIHITDSLERAKEIGREGFRKLAPPSEQAKDDLIELSGTKIERIAQAVRLAYTDVSDQEINFYVALSVAGLPVVLDDAEEILARYDGSDYIGIVPHDTPTRYCENLFHSEYGNVIDFMHIYDDEMPILEDMIIWLPEPPAILI